MAPRQGRRFRTRWYVADGSVVPYETLVEKPSFKGTCDFETIWLCEVWESCGDDGHTDYQLAGYSFIGERHLDTVLAELAVRYPGYPVGLVDAISTVVYDMV